MRSSRSAAALLLLVLGCLALGGTLLSDPRRTLRAASRISVALRGAEWMGTDGVVLQTTPMGCGPAALANLLKLVHGTSPSLDSLALLAGTDAATGTTLGGLAHAARVAGLEAAAQRLDPDTLSRTVLPLLAWVSRSHFVVLARHDDEGVVVLDPQIGRYRLSPNRLRSVWSGEALVPAPADAESGAPSIPSIKEVKHAF